MRSEPSNLDDKLQQLASENWAFFVAMIGKETLIIGKARLMRSEGMSYQQIATKLNISISQARHACNKSC